MAAIEPLSEEEAYLWAILSDTSGLDQAEFTWFNAEDVETNCFRAWPFQWKWWRDSSEQQIDQCGRSVGKSESIKVRAFAFPFINPGQEMVITAPEGNHLDAITDKVETSFITTRLGKEMIVKSRSGIKHRPFHINFANGSRIMGRIPQRDGKGVKGCLTEGSLVWTPDGFKAVEELAVGDLVMTHKNRWKPIVSIVEDINDCYEVAGSGSFPMKVSCDHRFYGSENISGSKSAKRLSELGFTDVEFLLENKVHWATPTMFPHVDRVPILYSNQAKRFFDDGVDFWWLVGRWLADGYVTFNGKSSRKVHWVVVPEKANFITSKLKSVGLNWNQISRSHSSADVVETCSTPFAEWLVDQFGKLADGKKLPAFVLSLPEENRQALLDGYLSGDGYWNEKKNRWEAGSASKVLASGLQLLAQSLGYKVTCAVVHPEGYKTSWRIHLSKKGHACLVDGYLVNKVKRLTRTQPSKVYNLVVEEDHSYLSGTIMSHNIHPIWLELDEAQDYPDDGWIEIFETLKQGHKGAMWRAHGVTRGLRDYFHKFTQEDSDWKVHRYTGMHRPTWSDEIRQKQIAKYGSKDHPDYRRNVLGKHGDATNPIFVLNRLMACVDSELSSFYNENVYTKLKINNEMLNEYNGDILPFIDFPQTHLDFNQIWMGMDVGYTNDPSEILVFAEETLSKNAPSVLKLISRIALQRIDHENQVKTILWLINFYKPNAFSMDKTGLGLPLFQDIQTKAKIDPNIRRYLDRIKGYNFSEKILVDFDDSIEVDEFVGDAVKEAGLYRNVLEYSTDKLRSLVDSKRLLLPWDKEVIGEFQGQTFTYDKGRMDLYGRARNFSKGSFHTLDAARMAVLGFSQFKIDEFTKNKDVFEPITPVFL